MRNTEALSFLKPSFQTLCQESIGKFSKTGWYNEIMDAIVNINIL